MAKKEIKSISTTEGTGKTKKENRMEVRKISNGYIMKETTEWNDPKKGWQYENTETYYENNPMKKISI